ncbi:MAG: CshA/CshB family fibrillar adhesin-related protein [Lachnospiraceae bacterium]
MSFSYAASGSGPSAGGIGWFDFGNLVIKPNDSIPGLTATLNDGTTVTFDIKSLPTSFVPFTAVPTPVQYAYFGSAGYTGILGNTALKTPLLPAYATPSTIVIDNIVVKDSLGNPVTNYTAVVADAESTNAFPQYTEYLKFNTTGGAWNLLATLGANPPIIAGVGSNAVTITGTNQSASQAAYVLTTQSPPSLTLATYGREAIAVGFAVTKVSVYKNIGDRIHSADQFVLDIAGTPSDLATTTGAAVGVQPEFAGVYGLAGNTYTINEGMAPGSVSTLSDYTTVVSAINLTPGGSVPPTGSLPINFTPALGDIVKYTILNAAPETFKKSVDKTNANLGDVLTYTVTIDNPNNFTLNNVLFTDPTPMSTTYLGNLAVNVPFTGTTPASGLTLTIPADTVATISWQVQVATAAPISNPITNQASVHVPGGTSGNTNPVSTQVNYADLTSDGNFNKSVKPLYAKFGSTLTYTLTLHNMGNVPANQVVIKDTIPAGTTYVAGSVSASVPFTGDPTSAITLTAPIPAGGTVTVVFQVTLSDSAPAVNPIPNTANVNYAYTVDPAHPNGAAASGNSNTVYTPVSMAQLVLSKATDKNISYIGEEITYHILVKNTGNVSADQTVITDLIPNGTVLVPGSLTVSEAYTGSPDTAIHLTGAVVAGQSVAISFKVKVTAIPNPNPIVNVAHAEYAYTVNPGDVDGVKGSATSNSVKTIIFVNNYSQQISDLIESVALGEAALGAIANAEGAKIQRFVAMPGVTPDMLLCLNKSVTDMTNSISLLESILMQKLNTVDCQITGNATCR